MALITEHDDRTLVERFCRGDEDAFRQIVGRHHRSLYANALQRLRDPALAEDAVQETLLRAFKALHRFNGDYKLDAWLHRIITNVCADMGRRQGRDSRLFDKVSGEVEVESPPADDRLEALANEQVHEALESLPADYREALVLRFVDEKSYPEMAVEAGITEQNARARVSRGRTMLRSMLGSASAAFIWLVPGLRRNQPALSGPELDAINQAQSVAQVSTAAPAVAQAAPAIAQSAPAVTQASALLSQAAPVIAQAAPVAAQHGPTIGKAAVAVGIAASVAIPAGVAVEQRLDAPEAAVAAPAPGAETPAPDAPVEPAPTGVAGRVDLDSSATSAPAATDDTVVPASGDAAVAADLDGPAADDDTAPGDSADTDTPTTVDTATPTTEPVAEEPEPAPAPEPEPIEDPAHLNADVTVAEAGPRLEIDGRFALSDGTAETLGDLAGKLLVGDAAGDAPRSVEGTLTLTFDDGTTADLRLRGTVSVTSKGRDTVHEFVAEYRLDGGAAHGVAEAGTLRGLLETRGGDGTLQLALPPADDAASDAGPDAGGDEGTGDDPAATDPDA